MVNDFALSFLGAPPFKDFGFSVLGDPLGAVLLGLLTLRDSLPFLASFHFGAKPMPLVAWIEMVLDIISRYRRTNELDVTMFTSGVQN